jgi:hypothetical protein
LDSYKKQEDIKQLGIHHRDTAAQSMLRILLDRFPLPIGVLRAFGQDVGPWPNARNDWPEENT